MDILILRGKYGDRYFKAETLEDKKAAALKIIKSHYEMGYYYNNKKRVEKIIDDKDGEQALKFIWSRSYEGYEYEGLTTDKLE